MSDADSADARGQERFKGSDGSLDARGDAGTDAGKDAGDMQAQGRFRDPEKARAAAQARWQKQRELEASESEQDAVEDDVRRVTVPLRVGAIIRAYEKEAASGNANAGRELRAWLEQFPPDDTELSTEKLDKKTRQRALAKVLELLAEEDAANETEA